MRSFFISLGIGIVLALAYFFTWPVPIQPVAWDAPISLGYVGKYAPNEKLNLFDKLTLGELSGPEAAVQAPNGDLVASTHEGWIVRWQADATEATRWIEVGGRPLGLDYDLEGNLWIANAYSGLMKLSKDGELSVAVNAVDGVTVNYADDVVVAPNGKIYFSDASTRFSAKEFHGTLSASLLDIMEHSDNGRVIEYDPMNKVAKVVKSNLTFANGVAADPSGNFILIVETGEYRVWKLWLTGDKAMQSEVIIDNIPGFPDNIHLGKDGRYWVGLTAPRSEVLDDLAGEPFWRKVIQRLPPQMRPKIEPHGMVIAINENGDVVANLQAPSGAVYATTGVAEADDYLYVTSLTAPFMARYKKADLGFEQH